MKYSHIVSYLAERPWAIQRSVLRAVLDIVAFRVQGGQWSAEEIRERVGDVEASRRAPARRGAVAIIPIQGMISPRMTMFTEISGGTSLRSFMDAFNMAMNDQDVEAIVLDVDSPGGVVDMIPETAAAIRGARGIKPVVAVADTTAASGAYWLASQAETFVISPSGQVGSIGCFSAHDDISEALAMEGIKTTLISAGKYKTEGNPYEPLGAEARAAMQSVVDHFYGMFVADIAKGRGTTPKAVREGFGEGRMVVAREAVAIGMADRLGSLEQVLSELVTGRFKGRGASADADSIILTIDGETSAQVVRRSGDEAVAAMDALTAAVRGGDELETADEATDPPAEPTTMVPGAERLLERPGVREAFAPAP